MAILLYETQDDNGCIMELLVIFISNNSEVIDHNLGALYNLYFYFNFIDEIWSNNMGPTACLESHYSAHHIDLNGDLRPILRKCGFINEDDYHVNQDMFQDEFYANRSFIE